MKELLDHHGLILMEAAIVEPIRRAEIVPLDPWLVHGALIYDPAGREELRKLYRQYAPIALDRQVPFLICTPTWRTNRERVRESGIDESINRHAVEFMREIAAEWNSPLVRIGGIIGCKHDCYQPESSLSPAEAEDFHAWQIEELAAAGVDFLFAVTLPAVDEALGIARAMAATGTPYVISFVINREGRILDGTPLADAMEQIDRSASPMPLGYMINCAHPTFLRAEQQPRKALERLIGFQGNASSLDHAALDGSAELRMDDQTEWGRAMTVLNQQYGVRILGGCCGTGSDHLRSIMEFVDP